ncbi:MAG: HAD-IIIA family hydrolase [Chitinophagaceae bacterium]|nr:HAD-IIIA family hydrolase [Chitinophagaceae bacterium]
MNLLERFKSIRTFVFDVDGVLTNGSIWITDDGGMLRQMNVKDGYALQLAVKKGYRIAIISGGTSYTVKIRMERLGINDVYLDVHDKKQKLTEYIDKHQLSPEEILFMGDDIPDYMAMQTVGLPCAPTDAVPEIKEVSRYISPVQGGQGCVRDVIEKVLKLNNAWPMDTNIPSR